MNLLQWFSVYAATVLLNYALMYFHDKYSWQEESKHEGIFNLKAIKVIVAWIPIYNIYFCYGMVVDIIAYVSSIKMLRKLFKQLHEDHPADENITKMYNQLHNIEDLKQNNHDKA